MNLFYNTTNESGPDLKEYSEKAANQNDVVYSIFQKCGCQLTPFDVHKIYRKDNPECPITSIRRAITYLTNEGRLIKSESKRKGDLGRNNFLWRVKLANA